MGNQQSGRRRGKGPENYHDRFQKFYYENRDKLSKAKKQRYYDRRSRGLCVRCEAPSNGKALCEECRVKR